MIATSHPSLVGLLVVVSAMGVMLLLCRWVFSTEHREDRARRTEPPSPRDYGLLVPVSTVRTRDDAEMLREVLAAGGVRASVSTGQESGGYVLLVFGKDAARARELVIAG